jgi:hypothetical protein
METQDMETVGELARTSMHQNDVLSLNKKVQESLLI